MRRYFNSAVLTLLSAFWSSAVWAVGLTSGFYAVYEKGAELYVVPKDSVLILHGDIATPIVFMPNVSGYIVNLSNNTFSSTALNANDLIVDGSYVLADYIVHGGDFNADGDGDILLQALNNNDSFIITDDGSPTQNIYYNFGLELSSRTLLIRDANGDGIADIVYNDAAIEYAYISNPAGGTFSLHNVSGVPSPHSTIDPADEADNDPVYSGTLRGQLTVNQQGAANYTIPIEVPPGIQDIQPKLGLSYNSLRRNGLLGWGWHLSGLSTISRCPATRVQNGYVDGINYDDDYKLCIDGQKLVPVGANEYRIENDSFIKITVSGNFGNSPGQFTVYRPNGDVLQYGYTADARRKEQGRADVYEWHLNRITDKSGNYLDVSYYNDTADGDHRPKRIEYTKNLTATSLNHSVDFVYEIRPDIIQHYTAGALQTISHRLSQVDIKTNAQLVRHYKLGYEVFDGVNFADPVKTSRINRIEQCFAAPGDCQSPVEFTWTSTAADNYTLRDIKTPTSASTGWTDNPLVAAMMKHHYVDVDGDGYLDLVKLTPSSTEPVYVKFGNENLNIDSVNYDYYQNLVNQPSVHVADVEDIYYTDITQTSTGTRETTYLSQVVTGVQDFNGDGKMDIFVTDNRHLRGVKVYLSTGRSFVYSPAFSIDASEISYYGSETRNGTTITGYWSYKLEYRDFNGDGLLDVVRYRRYPSCSGCVPVGDSPNIGVALNNNGTGFDNFQTWFTADNNWRKDLSLGDFNGDRLPDLMGYDGSVAINTGVGFELSSTWGAVTGLQDDYLDNAVKPITIADFNGDGLSDIIGFYNSGIKVYLSTGAGFQSGQFWSSFVASKANIFDLTLIDINADGRADILFTPKGGPSHQRTVYLSHTSLQNGQPRHEFVEQTLQATVGSDIADLLHAHIGSFAFPLVMQGYSIRPLDINQDGILDWLSPSGIKTHRLLSIREGGQWQADIQYLPLSQHGLHDVGSSSSDAIAASYSNQLSTTSSGHDSLPTEEIDQIRRRPANGRYGVAQIDTNNAVGGTTTKKYHYTGAKFHRSGWGDLGFETREVATEINGPAVIRRQVSTYSQEANDQYKLAGKLLQQTRYATDESTSTLREVSDTVNQWQVFLFPGDGGSHDEPHYFSFVSDSTTYHDDLDGSDRYGETRQALSYTSELPAACSSELQLPSVSTVTATDIVDNYGNIAQSVHVLCDSTGTYVSGRKQLYSNYTGTPWVLGRVTDTALTRQITDSAGTRSLTRTTSATYTPSGHLSTEVREPANADYTLTSTYLYNDYGSVRSITESWTDPGDDGLAFNSRQTLFDETYDAAGKLTVVTTYPLAAHTDTAVYEPVYGHAVFTTDSNGLITATEYDSRGRAIQIDHSDGTQTLLRYRSCLSCDTPNTFAHYYVHRKTQGQSAHRTYYDVLNREVGTRSRGFDGAFVHTSTEYDSLGRVKKMSLPFFDGAIPPYEQYQYDTLDRVKTRINPDTSTVSISYNGTYQTTTNELNQEQTIQSNGLGQLINSTDALQTTIHYRYTPFDDLEFTSINGVNVTINYDLLGRKTSITDPNVGTQSFDYNVLGWVYRHTDALSQQTETSYDKLGRQTSRTDNASAASPAGRTHTWIYDTATNGIGKLAQVQGFDTDGRPFTESYAYNARGLPTTTTTVIDGSQFATTRYYDDFSRDDGLAYPTGFAIENTYNSYGYLNKIHKPGFISTLYWQANAVDARGNTTQFVLGNGIVTDQVFDANTGRINAIKAYKGSWYAQHHEYTFDALGNLKRRQDRRGTSTITQDFCYDDLNRLTAARFNGCSINDNDFSYDALGNITSKQGVGNYSYGAGNAGPHAVTSAGGSSYVYDNNGNMVSGNGRTVTYTPFGKPKTISKGGNSVHIVYGPDENRLQRIDNTSRTTTYVGGLYEKVVEGSQITHTHYLGDFALYIEEAGSTSGERFVYLHRDHLGSLAAKTLENAQGDSHLTAMANEPWGVRTEQTWNGALLGSGYQPMDTARGFTDHEHLDGVGLIHMHGRVYDPTLGRFLSPDPYIQAPYNSQSFNRYAYVLNNPLSHIDPSGYLCVSLFGGAEAGDTCDDVGRVIEMSQGIGRDSLGNAVAETVFTFQGYDDIASISGAAVGATFSFAVGALERITDPLRMATETTAAGGFRNDVGTITLGALETVANLFDPSVYMSVDLPVTPQGVVKAGVKEAAKALSTKGIESGAWRLIAANNAKIDPRKLTEYALNPSHPVGGNKAKVFESALGFNKSNAGDLLKQIRAGVMNNTPIAGKVDKFGSRFTVDIPVTGPAGSATVRTGWIYKTGSDVPEMTTLFVK